MATYQLVVTVELERLDAEGAMAWRGNSNIKTMADIDQIMSLVKGDEIAVAVRDIAYRIVAEEWDKQHE